MHSLPSRRRLPQPNFFRFKCYRLSPLPISRPPPSLPAPAPALPGLLPSAAAHLPFDTPPPSVSPHTLTHTLTQPGAVRRQAWRQRRRPPSARGQTHPHTPGTVRQARLDGAVGRQGCRTFSQSANRDSVSRSSSPQLPPEPRASSSSPALVLTYDTSGSFVWDFFFILFL